MYRIRWVSAAALVSLLMWNLAVAHHSFAVFDKEKEVVLEGVIKEFQWTNPHAWIQFIATNEKGEKVEWSLEWASVNVLARQGWKKTSLKPGERLRIAINPMRDGSNGGSVARIMTLDGVVLPRAKFAGPAAAN